ncbi:MAG: hypothetical protein IPN42_01875 [Methylococcaceae bacterium]|nr:hypothetical protein [Methylococcaceae bacterium]
MKEPPPLIDSVRIIRYCCFSAEIHPTGRRRIFIGDDQLDLNRVRALSIGENLVDGGLMLLHCASNWDALAGFHYESTAAAEDGANSAYTGALLSWESFRELTSAELAEIENVRVELNASAHEHPDSSENEA